MRAEKGLHVHRTLRFLPLIGAALGIYLAAALQSGPDQVDANICALARRWNIIAPDQCTPSIDKWVLLAVWIVVAICMIFLLLDSISFLRNRSRPQANVQRDVWVYDAVCRMFLGRWDKIPTSDDTPILDQSEAQSVYEILERIRQLAFDDQFPIWGKQPGYEELWKKSDAAF